MIVLLFTLSMLLVALLLQLIVWRVSLPKNHSFMIVLIFLIVFGVALFILNVFGHKLNTCGLLVPGGLLQISQFVLLFLCSTLAYLITYTAIEARSPSVDIIMKIGEAGSIGLKHKEISSGISDERLVLPRLKELLDAGLVILKDGKYKITPLGSGFISIFIVFGKLMNKRGKGG